MTSSKPIRLNMGCGNLRREGFINIDFSKRDNKNGNCDECVPDMIHDLNYSFNIQDETVDEIYSSHVIEHLDWTRVPNILKEWCRMLKKGGFIEIWTLDIELVCEIYKNRKSVDDFLKFNKEIMNDNRRYEGSAHLSAFNTSLLVGLFEEMGMRVEVLDYNRDFPHPPFHRNKSVGVRAYK